MGNIETSGSKNAERQLSPEELVEASHEGKKRIHEQLEKRSHERSGETNKEREASARHEIERTRVENEKKPHNQHEASPEKHRRNPTGQGRKAAYRQIMSETQSQLSPMSRTFSKIIHNPVVENVSEAAGKTIARPNAILAGSVTAFVVVLGTYLIARYFGYPLSGFETIAAFVLGWILGNMFDFFRTMITGSR